ncbi:MAG: lysozyme inhibitor LprI family protein [Pseudomonadota bacterium]
MISTLLLLAPAAPMAVDLPKCDQEAAERGVQQEMNICAHRDFLIADAALNAQWKVTRAKMKARDADWESYKPDYATRPGWFASLLEAQRAWLSYRDAHCRVDGYAARGGSLEPLLVSTCKTALTEARTQELTALAESPD